MPGNGEGERVATALAASFSSWIQVAEPQPEQRVPPPPRPRVRLRHRVAVCTRNGEVKAFPLYEALGSIPTGADVLVEIRGAVDFISEPLDWIGPMLRDARTVELQAHGRAATRLRDELQRAVDCDPEC